MRLIGISLGNLRTFRDGIGEFSHQLCSRLAARSSELREQHRVELLFHVHEQLQGVFGDQVRYAVVHRSHEFLHRQPMKFALWHTLSQLNRYRPPASTPLRLATVHDLNFAYFKNGFSRWRDARRLRRLLNRSEHVVTISQHVRRDIQQRMNWSGSIQVIYNGARDLSQAPQETIPHLAPDQFLFHLSRMSASKNITALLNLAAAWPDKTMVLAGPAGPDHQATRAAVQIRGLSNVIMLENISDAQKAWAYARCQAFLFPSLTEGFGLPPIEAMYFGKPVFLSTLTCLPEIGGSAARYWQQFDAASMRQGVESTINSWTPQNAEQARQQAARYNWDRCAQNYLQASLDSLAWPCEQ